MTTETKTITRRVGARPRIWHEVSNAMVPMTDEELANQGWVRQLNGDYVRTETISA